GAINTPQLLPLSGIGPVHDLAALDILCIRDLPVGQNLRDHLLVPLICKQREGTNDRSAFFSQPNQVQKAREQFLASQTGPMSVFYNNIVLGYFKSEELQASDEFKALPAKEQR